MIRSFRDSETERVYRGLRARRLPAEIQRPALKKLLMLDAAMTVEDLRVPPGNRVEALTGTRRGEYSIRINQQWRICFRWDDGGPSDVEIVDYH